ncbi:MAG: hypothetical protein FWC21_02985 [Treponema sp.]|nr:hypothetical protein [Treponema sp.]
MKKIIFYALMILILAAAICSCGGKEGTFTLTDIPSKFNGNYIVFEAQDLSNEIFIVGLKEFDSENDNHWMIPISGGKAELPVWLIKTYDDYSRYEGSDTFEVTVVLFSDERMNSDMVALLYYESVEFKNGSVEISFNEADYSTDS